LPEAETKVMPSTTTGNEMSEGLVGSVSETTVTLTEPVPPPQLATQPPPGKPLHEERAKAASKATKRKALLRIIGYPTIV